MIWKTLALLFAAATVTGCFGDPIDRCIDDRATIASGVYGQLTSGCDTPDCEADYAVGTEVRVYDEDPGPYEQDGVVTPIATLASGELGFYQIELAAGTYYACTFICTELVVGETEPVSRWDWSSGPGGGFWHEAEACE
jgi:hypothetical protein